MDGNNIVDVRRSTADYIFKKHPLYFIGFVVFAAIFCLLMILFHWKADWLAVPVALGFGLYVYVFRKMQVEFMKEFAASIDFVYSPGALLDTVSGKLFSMGHSRRIFDVLSGTHDNIPIRIFSYSYTVGSGKNSHTYNFTVFEATLPNAVPEIILNSKKAEYGAADFSFFDAHSHVQLEGDFNKFFSLSVPKGFEQEAYEIFTPDVMADLIDKAQKTDFEFCGNHFYLYVPKTITTRAEIQALFELLDFLTPLFIRNASSIS